MVEQICEQCGARYSLYAPACPKCGAESTAPAKKPGCPQAPAPEPKPKAPAADKATESPAKAAEPAAPEKPAVPSTVTIETDVVCPPKSNAPAILALIGAAAAVCGILVLFRR